MAGDPRDRTAYGLAIVSLGLALAALILGVCWISGESGDPVEVAIHHCGLHAESDCEPVTVLRAAQDPPGVPDELWVALALLGGVFVGVLIPFPPTVLRRERWRSDARVEDVAVAVVWLALIGLAIVLAHSALKDSIGWCAIGGVLLGLLVPSPARGD
jgi:hypothetical protein